MFKLIIVMKSFVIHVVKLTILLCLVISCKKEDPVPVVAAPTPGFNFVVMDAGLVRFTNTSTDATSYFWTFGDGSTSTQESPDHAYATNSTFTVVLTATGPGGSTSLSQSVTVSLKSSFLYTLQHKWTIQFANTSTNAETFFWAFGDGTFSTDRSPIHSYASPGTYLVELTVSASGETQSSTKSVLVQGILVGNWSLVNYQYAQCTDFTKNLGPISCNGCITLVVSETQITKTIPQPGGGATIEVYSYVINGTNISLTYGAGPAIPATFLFAGSSLTLTFTTKTDSFNTCKYNETYSKL